MAASRPLGLSLSLPIGLLLSLLASSLLLTPVLSAEWGAHDLSEQNVRRMLRQADIDFDPVARVLLDSSDDEAPAPSSPHGRAFLDVSISDDSGASLSTEEDSATSEEQSGETVVLESPTDTDSTPSVDESEDEDEDDEIDEDTPSSRGTPLPPRPSTAHHSQRSALSP